MRGTGPPSARGVLSRKRVALANVAAFVGVSFALRDQMIENLSDLLAAATSIEENISAIRRGAAAAAAVLRDLDGRLAEIGFSTSRPELLAGDDDDLARVVELARDLSVRAKRACEIHLALAGREVRHA